MPVTFVRNHQLSEKGQLCTLPPQRRDGQFCFGLQLLNTAEGSGHHSDVVRHRGGLLREESRGLLKSDDSLETNMKCCELEKHAVEDLFIVTSCSSCGITYIYFTGGTSGYPERSGHAEGVGVFKDQSSSRHRIGILVTGTFSEAQQ